MVITLVVEFTEMGGSIIAVTVGCTHRVTKPMMVALLDFRSMLANRLELDMSRFMVGLIVDRFVVNHRMEGVED